MLRSDTAWAEFADSSVRSYRSAHRFARGVECREGTPYIEQLEFDRDCSCILRREGEVETAEGGE